MILYRNTKVKVRSPDGDTDYFDIVAGVQQGDKLAPYLFIICLDSCHRFSELAVLAAPPLTLTGGSTAAPPRSVDLCLAVRGTAGEGPDASVDWKSERVAVVVVVVV